MQINTTGRHLDSDPVASDLINFLRSNELELELGDAQIYHDFPIFKELDGAIVVSKVLLVSPRYGVIIIETSDSISAKNLFKELPQVESHIDRVFTLLYSRLIRNKNLKKGKKELSFPTESILFAPLVQDSLEEVPGETVTLVTHRSLQNYLETIKIEPIAQPIFQELIATIEGAKGLLRPRPRELIKEDPHSKGYIVNKLESEIASFDQHQKYGYMTVLDGLQRIRGLAGSGKTVVLAMKAALMHLRDPEARIIYTFYTRSLYQLIQRLITRFYRQFDDRDPDWSKLKVFHAWGGINIPGVYFDACETHAVRCISYTEAAKLSRRTAFDYVCRKFLEDSKDIRQIYDYTFIDEGQDFPASFLKLCVELTKNKRVVWAYDDLQTIFQAATPTPAEIFGKDGKGEPLVELSEDIVLYKCYRNPREILVCAHALGFGIYGSRIVQMLENREHWEDIGYKICSGEFVEGSNIVVERPAEYSLTTISQEFKPEEIVQVKVFDTYKEEITEIAKGILEDIEDGLNPDDILVIVVDDLHARSYLRDLEQALASLNIESNNIHSDSYGLRDFSRENQVTLSTVYKAKGNEAMMVYIIGVDSLFSSYAGVRERNILFTAMTRAKGWVNVSGIGRGAETCKKEIKLALNNFPYLIFKYPSKEQLKIMRRDLEERAIRKQKVEHMLDQIMEEMTPEEIRRFVEQRSIKKGGGKKVFRKKH